MDLVAVCLEEGTEDAMRNLRLLTAPPAPMNGPMHHRAVPLALITAYWHADPFFDLEAYLREAEERAASLPEASCGYCGCCGAAVGAGIFHSVVTRTGPLTRGRRWGNGNILTSEALRRIGEVGGPRCCKRDSALAVQVACDMSEELLGKRIACSEFACGRSDANPKCIGSRCPFMVRK